MNLMQRRNNYLVFNEINKPLLSLTRKAGAFIIFFQRLMRLIFLYIIISTFGEKPYLNNLIDGMKEMLAAVEKRYEDSKGSQ